MKIQKEHIQKLSSGSLLLGCGGGGNAAKGLDNAKKALEMGDIELLSIEEVEARCKAQKQNGVIVTMSGVGSPSTPDAYHTAEDYPVMLEALQQKLDKPIVGLIACEIGGSSTFEPFIPAALLNVPVIDAPCDGRAHPLGLMGALGLEQTGQLVYQSVSGGKVEKGTRVEMVVHGTVETTSALVRNASAAAGGFIGVARNPVDLDWLKKAGAPGAYQQALQLGEIWENGKPLEERVQAVADALNGEVLIKGTVSDFVMKTGNALDRGNFVVCDGDKAFKLYYFNEYMALETDGQRIHTFPDPIITIDADTGKIMTTADIADGQRLYVIASGHAEVILGAGLKSKGVYKQVEEILDIDMVEYLENLF